MMNVDGGARSRADRKKAIIAAKSNFNASNIKQTVGGMSSYSGMLIGVGAIVCAVGTGGVAVVGAGLAFASSTAGFLCSY